ncbi:hypothetical protein TWF694_011270 [Orbilia ellipsospora]|uniref:NB-ARC domain-containing protein n=1 Tax=Orbilia ellipsospora TaxID=2528407 RepID=A0AAV9X9S6_9PEZI
MRELNPDDYTILWIALRDIEARAAILMLDHVHDGKFALDFTNNYVYQAGDILGHNVIIVTLPADQEPDDVSAGSLASQVNSLFCNLWFGLLVGVASSLPRLSEGQPVDIRLGDVLVAVPEERAHEIIWRDFGVKPNENSQPWCPGMDSTASLINSAVKNIRSKQLSDAKDFLKYYEEIKYAHHRDGTFIDPGQENDRLYHTEDDKTQQLVQRKARPVSDRTQVWYDPIGSGDMLLTNDLRLNELREERRIIGLVVETTGVVKYVPFGVIRGLCDYGDGTQNKEWRPYAAAMAAAYAKAVLRQIPPPKRTVANYNIPTSLPYYRNHNFEGREDIFQNIRLILHPTNSSGELPAGHSVINPRGVCLCGLGGSGKTSIALEYAYRYSYQYSAVIWIDAAQKSVLNSSSRKALELITEAYSEVPSPKTYQQMTRLFGLDSLWITSKEALMNAMDRISSMECLKSWLRQKFNDRWLLIIDNYDDKVTANLDALLLAQNAGHTIITSRNLESHRLCQSIEVPPDIEKQEAVNLLSNTLGRKFTSSELPSVSHIIELVGRLPLTIANTGHFLHENSITVEAFAERLDANLEDWSRSQILSKRPEDLLEPFYVVSETSFSRLSENAKHLLQLLSLIERGNIPKEILAGGKDIVDWMSSEMIIFKAVDELCSFRFLERNRSQHYDIHPLVHEWVRGYKFRNMNTKADNFRLINLIVISTFRFDKDRTSSQSAYERSILPHIDCCLENLRTLVVVRGGCFDEENRKMAYKLGRVYANLGDVLKASEIYKWSLEGVGSIASKLELRIMDSLGVSLTLQRKYDEALLWCTRALEGTKSQIGDLADTSESLIIASHIATILRGQGSYREAITQFRDILKQLMSNFGDSHSATLEAKLQLALVLRASGELSEALSLLQQIQIYNGPEGDNVLALETVQTIATIMEQQAAYAEALKYHKLVYERQRKSLGDSHMLTLETMASIGRMYDRLEEFKNALGYYQEILERLRIIFRGESHPWIPSTLVNIANTLMRQGRYKEAERLYKNAHTDFKRLQIKPHGEFPTATNVAGALLAQGNYEKALMWCKEAREGLKSSALHENHPAMLINKICYANILELQGDYQGALVMYRQALAGYEKKPLAYLERNEALRTMRSIGCILSKQGQYLEVLKLLNDAEKGLAKAMGIHHSETLKVIRLIGDVFGKQKRYQEALELLDRAEKGLTKALGADHPEALRTVRSVGDIFNEQGRYAEALELLNQVEKGLMKAVGEDHPETLEVARLISDISSKQKICKLSLEGPEIRTDSGYASRAYSYSEQTFAVGDNIPYHEGSSLQNEVESSDCAETVYSEVSSISPFEKREYISLLAEAIYDKVCLNEYGSGAEEKVLEILPDLLKDFAFKLGHNPLSQMHRDVMFFIHKHHSVLAGPYKPFVSKTRNLHTYYNTFDQGNEDLTFQGFGGGEIGEVNGDETDTGSKATERYEFSKSQVLGYVDFIRKSSAYEWFVGRLQRELFLVPANPNIMLTIRERILEFLKKPRRVSKSTPTESFKIMFQLNSDIFVFLTDEGYLGGAEDIVMGDAVGRAITLTGSLVDSQALTCAEYLQQTWSSGVRLMQLIKDVIHCDLGSVSTCELAGNTKLKARIHESKLVVETLGTRDSVAEVGEQLAWLGAALSSSSHELGVAYCVASIGDIRIRDPGSSNLEKDLWDDVTFDIDFKLEGKGETPLNFNTQCWHGLFANTTVVKGFPILRRVKPNTGLEMPLNMMARLVQADYINTFDKKPHMKGFSSMLVAVAKEDDMVMWHLFCNLEGDRISYLEGRSIPGGIQYLGISELEKFRHFVGWCSEANYNAGSANADYNISSTHLPRVEEGCILEGVRLRPGLRVQNSDHFVIGKKDLPNCVSRGGYKRKVRWIHEQHVILWDVDDKRGWLINGTSALMHLLRRFLAFSDQKDFGEMFTFKEESITEAQIPNKASSALSTLCNPKNLNIEIYSGDEDENEAPVCLKDKLNDILNILEQIMDYQVDIAGIVGNTRWSRRYLEGWEFNDVAKVRDLIEPCMTTLPPRGKSWIDFTRGIHAITLFGSGFGEIFQPTRGLSCAHWKTLPKDNYFLAASVEDLNKIAGNYKNKQLNPMKLTRGISWYRYGRGSDGCCQEGVSDRHLDPVQVLLPSTPEFYAEVEFGTENLPIQLDGSNAVVFGQNKDFPWFWKDTGDPEKTAPPQEVDEPEIWQSDSGIGSSESSTGSNITLEDYHIGVICALSKELMAVRALFDAPGETSLKNDSNSYVLGAISHHNVVATCLPSGMTGHPTGAHPGVIQHDRGKRLQGTEFERTGYLSPPPISVLTAISILTSNPNRSCPLRIYLERITQILPNYKHPGIPDLLFDGKAVHAKGSETCENCESPIARAERKATNNPIVHYGLIASGNQVIKDSETRDRLGMEGVICVEMEAAGLLTQHPCLVIRGICDYADSHKNDLWQEYACATAAAYLGYLLSSYNKLDEVVQTVHTHNPIEITNQSFQSTPNKRKHGLISV